MLNASRCIFLTPRTGHVQVGTMNAVQLRCFSSCCHHWLITDVDECRFVAWCNPILQWKYGITSSDFTDQCIPLEFSTDATVVLMHDFWWKELQADEMCTLQNATHLSTSCIRTVCFKKLEEMMRAGFRLHFRNKQQKLHLLLHYTTHWLVLLWSMARSNKRKREKE